MSSKKLKKLKDNEIKKLYSLISIESGCLEPSNVTNSFKQINGSVQNETGRYIEGSKVFYQCINGYERQSGNLQQECLRDATKYFWSGAVPVCERNNIFLFKHIFFFVLVHNFSPR